MRFTTSMLAGMAMGVSLAGCGDNGVSAVLPQTFSVRIENVSVANTIATPRANGTVPLSPGAFAVFSGTDPMFTPASQADAGTELIAEDGEPDVKLAALARAANIRSGLFQSPGGPDNGPAIFAGEAATFTITASPGERLQIETMFVQSNDWFYAFGGGGLQLFNGSSPISGNVTAQLVLYDAGTEEDTSPGTGPNQKPVQSPTATNFGPPDANKSVRIASFPGFTIPTASAVIRVTITPVP